MSDTGTTISSNHPPSPPRECRDANGYGVCFYPGFASRVAVKGADGTETVLYEQKTPFILPAGQVKPWPSCALEFRDQGGRRILLQVDDPDQRIDRIEVRLKPEEGSDAAAGEGDTLVCTNAAVLCPPICPE